MKTQLENKASRLNLNLGIVMLVCLMLSLGFNNVFAGRPSMPIDGGSSSSEGPTQPNLEEAKTALGLIQDAQENYKLIHGEYFFSLETAELETALGIELPGKQDFYYAAGTGPVGTAQAIDSDVTCTIYDTDAEATCLCAGCEQEPQGGGNRFILSDSDFLTGGPVHSSPVMINLDADDEGELIVGSDDGNVYAWDYDEVQGWIAFIDPVNNLEGIFAQTDAGFNVKSTPAIDDINIVDNDGLKEVVVGTNARKVYVWRIMDPSGTPTVENVSGWPKTTGSFQYIVNSAVLANLDSDPDLEIIVAGQNGAVYVWNPDGSGLVNTDGLFSQPQGNVNSSPAVGDLDNDGYKEIVVAVGNKLFVWYYNYDTEQVVGLINTNGLFVQVGSTIYSSPALADIDGDGFLEVIVGSDDNKLYAFNHDASPVEAWPDETAGWPQDLGADISSSPSIANIKTYPEAIDLEYNQDLEIVVGVENGEVYAFHHDGRRVSGWPVDRTDQAMSYLHDSSPALADIVDNDGLIEVIIGCWDGKLYAYHDDGSPVSGWPKPADPDIMGAIELSSPSIGLLENTEYLDVAIGSTDSFIYTWGLNGTFSADFMPWSKYRLDYRNTATYQRADRIRPLIDAISDKVVEIETPLSFDVDAHDPPSNIIIDISAYDVPGGANFSYTSPDDSGTFSWTPASADIGDYIVYFIATDEYGLHSERAEANITVTEPSNTPPIAVDDFYSMNEDDILTILTPEGVLYNDIDNEGDPLTVKIPEETSPSNGTLVLNEDGSFTYDPDDDYNGIDTFTYKAFDGVLYSETAATVSITVNPVNDPPTAVDDSDSTLEDTLLITINVLENDGDIEGDSLEVTDYQNPSANGGNVSYNGDYTFTYDPPLSFNGNDTFDYTITEMYTVEQYSASATVDIDVIAVNDRPEANNDSYTTYEGHELVIDAPGVLENDTDIDGPNPLIANKFSDPSNGTLVLSLDGSFTYTPNPDYIGPDDFSYVANDGIEDSEIATVNIDVEDYVCDGPVRLYDETGDLVECFENIQGAIDYFAVDHGYTIKVDPGTYYEDVHFSIDKAITVESTTGANNTIIDGYFTVRAVTFDPSDFIITLRGFKIRYGFTSENGAGILIDNAAVNIEDCIVKYNQAGGKGGGIACLSTHDVHIENTDFIDNSAGDPSANSMYVADEGLVTVSHCLIKQETVVDDDVCLLPGTKIQLADGTAKSIEEVNIGDEVLAINKEGQVASGKVLKTFYHPDTQGFYVIKTEDGNTLKITGNHPVHNCKDFVEAGSLKVGDKILVVDSKDKSHLLHSKIVSMIKEDSIADVYNLEVDLHHTYVADGVVVHNKKMKKINEIESP